MTKLEKPADLDQALDRLNDCVSQLESLDVRSAILARSGAIDSVRDTVTTAVTDVFGADSPEYREYATVPNWLEQPGGDSSRGDVIEMTEDARLLVERLLRRSIRRLSERRELVGRTANGGAIRAGVAVIVALAAGNVFFYATRETGPDPALEAMHSAEQASERCRIAIESELAGQGVVIQGGLATEYLQGGEYEVKATVTLLEAGRRVQRSVLCEAQFRSSGELTVEDVAVER